MKLPNLIAGKSSENPEDDKIFLFEQQSEKIEKLFVLEAIKHSNTPKEEIFVLARTNKVLESYADLFDQQGIEYTIKKGMKIFEAGAQGEQKLLRGFIPVIMKSAHHIKHPQLFKAIKEYIAKSFLKEFDFSFKK